jgi:hypothetical protein
MKPHFTTSVAIRMLLTFAVLFTANASIAAGTSTAGKWRGTVTFNFVNATNGQYPDEQVHWAIIGKDWDTGQFVHVDANGKLKEMTLADNGALTKNGRGYTNYFQTLAQQKTITVPLIDSARVLFSVGSEPVYLEVNKDINGRLGYAGPNIENPNDANQDVIFDFIEMAITPTDGIYINTSRVDHFGFPIRLRLQAADGYDKQVGELPTMTRAQIFSDFSSIEPRQFQSLVKAPYRIIAPAHGSFRIDGNDGHYLDAYIDEIWEKYRLEDLVFTNHLGTFTGRVQTNGVFLFTSNNSKDTYRIKAKPTTAEVMLGNGVLDDAGDANGGEAIKTQLQVQAQLCAALNRHVAETPEKWADAASYYPPDKASNTYSAFWHDRSIDRLTYGFAYDDVWHASSSLYHPAPTTATVTIGW